LNKIREIPWVGNIPEQPVSGSTGSLSQTDNRNSFIQRIFPQKKHINLEEVRENLRKNDLPIDSKFL
jgi:hypothetical protein